MVQCIALKRDGTLCQGIATHGGDHCPAHDPARAEARKISASRAARSKRPNRELAQIKEEVAELIQGVRDGEVDRADAIACSQLYNVLLRAISVGVKVREVEELEQRLNVVEETLEEEGA